MVMVCSVVMSLALAQDRWVWGPSNPEVKSRKIPGFVATTPEPPITTFRPSHSLSVGRGFTPSALSNRLLNHPFFFPEGFLPFDFVNSDVPRINDDGTTKSRVTADSATLDTSSGATLTAHDKYTTLDRLQRERGPPPSFPPPQRQHLGGLHPDEVFYADDDLLIIRGGGFNSDVFQEPSQPLDDDDDREDIDESSRIVSSVSPPSTDQEYNGNIPVIIPPPKESDGSIPVTLPRQFKPSPFSIFVGGSSKKDYILVPYVEAQSPKGSNLDTVLEAVTHNHLSVNESKASSLKLRRAVSTIIPYVYPAPANAFVLHHARRQPPVQSQRIVQNSANAQRQFVVQPIVHQQRFVQTPTIVQQQNVVRTPTIVQQHPVVQYQQTYHRQAPVHREPIIQYQPVLQQQRPAVASHYAVPSYPVVEDNPVVHSTLNQDYPELELQPEVPQVFHSLEGDTNVNYLPPLPRRDPAAEVIKTQHNKPSFVHTHQRNQRPRV